MPSSILTTFLTETIMNKVNRTDLQEAYIHQLIDGMDWKTMEQFVYDSLDESLSKYSEAELITEVEDYYPELLED